jgi:hypothetical protein
MSNQFKCAFLLAAATAFSGSSISGASPIAQLEKNSILPDPNALAHPHVENEIMVRFHPGTEQMDRNTIFSQIGAQVKSEYMLVPDLYCLQIGVPVSHAIRALEFRGDILRYVEPVYVLEYFDTLPNDPDFSQLWGMANINAPVAWDSSTGTPSLRVAIIDSGIDLTHPDLQANIISNAADPIDGLDNDNNGLVDDHHGWDFNSNDNDPTDGNGHGTHTSGTVAAVGNNGLGVVGVNWNCEIIPLRVGDQSLSSSAIYASVDYACEMGAKVSNNSYGGGGYSQTFFDIIESAGENCQHVFCAAAGNDGVEGASYPAAYELENIISVAAINTDDSLASFSQYGIPSVDIGAPGVGILSTTPGGYSSYSGTSMATPHVAGVAALVHGMLADASALEVIEILTENSRPTSSMTGIVNSGGVLDAAAALDGLFRRPRATLITEIPAATPSGDNFEVIFEIDPRDDVLVSKTLYYRDSNSDFPVWVPLELIGQKDQPNIWNAMVPVTDCDSIPQFYLVYSGAEAGIQNYPLGGAQSPLELLVGELDIAINDDFQTDQGWSVEGDSQTPWARGMPGQQGGNWVPHNDADGSGMCYLTGLPMGGPHDLDGSTTLTSPIIDASGGGALEFAYWLSERNSDPHGPEDSFQVFVSSTSSADDWVLVRDYDSYARQWVSDSLDISIGGEVEPTSSLRLRFIATDADPDGRIEAGVDAVIMQSLTCGVKELLADLSGNGRVDGEDLSILLSYWGQVIADYDIDGNGTVGGSDLTIMLSEWSL